MTPGADVFPFVATTYRLTEHFTAGGMSRWTPYLAELQPEFFVEVSPELAAERRLEHGGWATIVSARGVVEARVMVTDRMTPLQVDGRTVHQIGMPYHWGPNGYARGDSMNELSAMSLDPSSHIQEVKVADRRRSARAGARAGPRASRWSASTATAPGSPPRRGWRRERLRRPAQRHAARRATPRPTPGYVDAPPRMGFFTDTSVCIGCKACEVACKEWNGVPEDGLNWTGWSHDNSQGLGADTWRHVAFIEQRVPAGGHVTNFQRDDDDFRWLMSSDVCKHCTHAACLDVCPTGAIFRTEFGTVVVQADVCNGCGYCVPGLPLRGAGQARG